MNFGISLTGCSAVRIHRKRVRVSELRGKIEAVKHGRAFASILRKHDDKKTFVPNCQPLQ